jgi:hypothetical protein
VAGYHANNTRPNAYEVLLMISPLPCCVPCAAAGYFTSRPTCKAFIRSATSTLTAARQLQLLAGLDGRERELGPLGAAAALAQHHDAVTGTAKQEVANDYNRWVGFGWCV